MKVFSVGTIKRISSSLDGEGELWPIPVPEEATKTAEVEVDPMWRTPVFRTMVEVDRTLRMLQLGH